MENIKIHLESCIELVEQKLSRGPCKEWNIDDFAFTGKSTTEGLPNSVVFEYDASPAGEEAKIEIQQDWLGVIELESSPIYLSNKDFMKEHSLEITPEILAQYEINPSTSKTVVGFYQFRDFGDIYTDEFQMSLSLKNSFKSGVSACQACQVIITHEEEPISIILTNKGCISGISLFAFNHVIDGKINDLSDFGVDFSEYVQLKCISENQKLDISINNKTAFSFDVPESPGKIVGISIFFEGAGSFRNVELMKKDEVVYASNF